MKRLLTYGFWLAAAVMPLAAGKLDRELEQAPPGAMVNVIVQYPAVPSNLDLSRAASRGGFLKARFAHMRSASFSMPAAVARALAADPAITHISLDRPLAGTLEYAEPTVNANIALSYGWDGNGIGVAIIDSGINASHPDLQGASGSRVVYSQSFVPNDSSTNDAYGHGTHVAGIVAGNGASSSGLYSLFTFRGIAPKAQLINLRVLDANGRGTDSAVIAAIDRAIDLKSTYNIRVMNLSLGRQVQQSFTLDPLCQAVEAAWKEGIVVVVAAGNNGRDNSMGTSGYATITAPGNDPYVITVGAMKDMGTVLRGDDLIASYSSKGPTLYDHVVKPDLVAPGNNIISALAPNSTIPALYPGNAVPLTYYKGLASGSSMYFRLSGTSMATPMVSGAAALLLEKNNDLKPDIIKARLMKTATKSFPSYSIAVDPVTGISYTSQYDLFTIGAGYLDIWAALNNSDTIPDGYRAVSPQVLNTSTGVTLNGSTLVWGESMVWGSSLVWGNSIVWGTNVLVSGSALVWGDTVVWGTSTTSGYSLVWGSSVVWGSSQPFSLNLSAAGER